MSDLPLSNVCIVWHFNDSCSQRLLELKKGLQNDLQNELGRGLESAWEQELERQLQRGRVVIWRGEKEEPCPVGAF